MKSEWTVLNTGDLIKVKNGKKILSLFVSDPPAHPITKTESIECISFDNGGASLMEVKFHQFIKIESTYSQNMLYEFSVGDLIEINSGKKTKTFGTIIKKNPPLFRLYPRSVKIKIHEFFVPCYDVLLTDNSVVSLEERKLKLISKPS